MAIYNVIPPYQMFFDAKGKPLDNGEIYIGEVDLDPETNQIETYWDKNLTKIAEQPIITINGYPQYNGTPARVYITPENYSITVKNKNGETQYYSLSSNINDSLGRYAETMADLVGYNGAERSALSYVNLGGFYENNDGGGGLFKWNTSGDKADHNGGTIIDPDIGVTPGAAGWWTATGTGPGVWEMINIVKARPQWFGLNASATSSTNLSALDATTAMAYSEGVPIDFGIKDTYTISGLWHVNVPVSIEGAECTLKGGDTDGVVWYGYRTGANQNVYYQQVYVRDLTVENTATGPGFVSSKTLRSEITSLKSIGGTGDGIIFRAAVSCQFNNIYAYQNAGSGITWTYFTNADGTTYVPSTANTMINTVSNDNATLVTDYGVLFPLNPDLNRAAYGNTMLGGTIEGNNFSGMRVYGTNNILGIWFEGNGADPGTTGQYHLWVSGDDVTAKFNRFYGAGVHRKVFLDDGIDRPIIRHNEFANDLVYDIFFDGTGITNHDVADNEFSNNATPIFPTVNDLRGYVFGDVRKNDIDGDIEWVTNVIDAAANATGSAVFYELGVLTDAQTMLLTVYVYDPGTPPTLIGTITDLAVFDTGVNHYQRFTTVYNERYSVTTTDSNTANNPIIRIASTGAVQYKQNNGSSAKRVAYKYMKMDT